ncbi:MAG: hypothetical protein HY543_10320 [Deltaproteobacteria bacterium]|nr:hypothetical protein [Deltaproteobacteria bacterium]
MSDVLVVASKVKQYIKDKAGMNTSATAMEALTGIVKKCCDEAMERARQDGRKTVMDRDFGPCRSEGGSNADEGQGCCSV